MSGIQVLTVTTYFKFNSTNKTEMIVKVMNKTFVDFWKT